MEDVDGNLEQRSESGLITKQPIWSTTTTTHPSCGINGPPNDQQQTLESLGGLSEFGIQCASLSALG